MTPAELSLVKRLVDTIVSLCNVFQKDFNKLSSYRDAMQLIEEHENVKNAHGRS